MTSIDASFLREGLMMDPEMERQSQVELQSEFVGIVGVFSKQAMLRWRTDVMRDTIGYEVKARLRGLIREKKVLFPKTPWDFFKLEYIPAKWRSRFSFLKVEYDVYRFKVNRVFPDLQEQTGFIGKDWVDMTWLDSVPPKQHTGE